MKKLIALLLLVLGSSVYAEYNANRPEWKDFCPFGYENIENYNTKKSIIGTDKHWQIKEYNYWVDRKKDFNRELKICDEISDNADSQNQCYFKLSERQNRLNQNTITPLQVWQNKKSQWQQASRNYMMYDAIKNPNVNVNGKMNVNVHHW